MSREPKYLLISTLASAFVTFGSIVPVWLDLDVPWGFLALLSLPGAIIAFLLGVMGITGNAHDPSTTVIVFVDFFFYARLFYWLMDRRWRRGHSLRG